jgi:methyltransferase (TIGR00027 family)
MIDGQPSRTAWSAALHRAAHQVVDGGSVFSDPVAVPIAGWTPERVVGDALRHPQRRGMRAFIACRHRYARDILMTRPDAQVLVLGAGLDTTAYQPATVLRGTVFEVDHPATQAWKTERLAEGGIRPTAPVRYVPVDFETDDLTDALQAAGFDRTCPVVVIWLGVTVYLTAAAVEQTLATLSRLTTGRTDLVLDYSEPDSVTGAGAERRAARSARVAALGEPWLTHFTPAELAALLGRHGFEVAEDLGLSGWGGRYLGLTAATPDRPSGHLVHGFRTP